MKEVLQLVHKNWGPGVKAQFFVSKNGVTKVLLFPLDETKRFEWEIVENQPAPKVSDLIVKWIESYCEGCQPKIEFPIQLDGLPPYTTHVLSFLRKLPIGKTLSYQELAKATDNPSGARAVGNACGRNPCPLIIPCHRVLASGGGLGGFSGGLEIKKRLLAFEGVKLTK